MLYMIDCFTFLSTDVKNAHLQWTNRHVSSTILAKFRWKDKLWCTKYKAHYWFISNFHEWQQCTTFLPINLFLVLHRSLYCKYILNFTCDLLQGTCYASTSAQGTNARGENNVSLHTLTIEWKYFLQYKQLKWEIVTYSYPCLYVVTFDWNFIKFTGERLRHIKIDLHRNVTFIKWVCRSRTGQWWLF
jgi:hypothetical protein